VTAPSDAATIRAERLGAIMAHFQRAGFARREPKLLQPAGVFLDRRGEDFRGRLYLTSDAGAAELCLRPEYTIPIALDYLASHDALRPAAFAYGGLVFRAGDGELAQAGIESFAREDREAADAEILAEAMGAAQAAGAGGLVVRFGDAGLVSAFLDELSLAPAWRRRIETGHAKGRGLSDLFAPSDKASDAAGVLAALEKVDPAEAKRLVEDLLSIAGITAVGGRSAGEIAERFLEQATLADPGGVPSEKRALIDAFFGIEGSPDAASASLRRLAASARLDLGAELDRFDMRSGFIAARGLPLDSMAFSASFARRLDYYSGFVFEAKEVGAATPALVGGRYDRLLRTLGAADDVAAVGAAIWVDAIKGERP
jgi:ATP phosphoribosyltransferase regulatory subunit